MAIRFQNGSLSTPETNVYSLSNFNGVDYTTTPTLVDDSRAIDISNYLPQNNTLAKRNGWSLINTFSYYEEKYDKTTTLYIHNIWKFKNNKDTNEETNTKYIFFADVNKESEYSGGLGIYYANSLTQTEDFRFFPLYIQESSATIKKDPYFYGVIFENRLFILAMNKYFMIYYDQNGQLGINEVKNVAFIPQVIVGLGHKDSQDVSAKVNDFNLLRNECYIELLNYPQTTEEQVLTYDIGQFFGSKMTNISISKVDNTNYEDNMEYKKPDETYVGKINFNNITKTLTITKEALEEGKETLSNVSYINLHIKFDSDNYKIVENMKFGISFGSSGYRDRLFLSGNPEYPNLDIHTNDTGLQSENWLDYTYFGDMSYRTFGTDAQKITGYGILNNGYMAVFKETSHSLEPNLYIRKSEIIADSNGNYVENFPVSLSGITIGSDEVGQVINYGNDLLINSPKGIYKVSASNSTATQTYDAQEMSYFIRDNLGFDISDSCSIIFEGKLYIARKDYKGDLRVYVADQNKYSYMNDVRIYEWWVLDNINATKFYVFDNELYFTDPNRGLCKFNNEYYDEYSIKIEDVKVNDSIISKEVSIDTFSDYMVLSPECSIIQNIMKKEDIYESYINFKKTTTISFNAEVLAYVKSEYCEFVKKTSSDYELKFVGVEDSKSQELLKYAAENKLTIVQLEKAPQVNYNYGFEPTGEYRYVSEMINGILKDVLVIPITLKYMANVDVLYYEKGLAIYIPENTKFEIEDIYEQYNKYPLSQCFVNNNTWYREDKNEQFQKNIYSIGNINHIIFNKLRLKFCETTIFFISRYEISVSNVKFDVKEPIVSYWKSKHNSLGRLDYLKTIYSITLIPDTKFGCSTNVSYKTAKSEVSFDLLSAGQDFNFELINFEDFTFGGEGIAKTYTSKKKIKNFSFIQLKFSSNDPKNSSIVSLGFRYKYTRLNKGER